MSLFDPIAPWHNPQRHTTTLGCTAQDEAGSTATGPNATPLERLLSSTSGRWPAWPLFLHPACRNGTGSQLGCGQALPWRDTVRAAHDKHCLFHTPSLRSASVNTCKQPASSHKSSRSSATRSSSRDSCAAGRLPSKVPPKPTGPLPSTPPLRDGLSCTPAFCCCC